MTSNALRYSEAELRLFQQLKDVGYSPKVIYDIGASNGIWSCLISGVFESATYHLFEPLADKLKTYRDLLQRHLGEKPNLHLHKVGLGDRNETQEMAIFKGGFGSTFLELERIKATADSLKKSNFLEEIAAFPVRRLDDYVADYHLPTAQIIKMDTQGFEIAIIQGGQKSVAAADILVLETWLYRGYGETTPLLHELMVPLTALGFLLVDFGDIYWGSKRRLTSIDAVFMRESFLDAIEQKTSGWNWRIWK